MSKEDKLKVGDVCSYIGNMPWRLYDNCVVHEVRDDGNYMVKFDDGSIDISSQNELVKKYSQWSDCYPYLSPDYVNSLNLFNIDKDVISFPQFKIVQNFKKGDRVECINHPNDSIFVKNLKGLKGTVLETDELGWTIVEFDENIGGHSGSSSNSGKHGHCWGMGKECLKLITKEEEKNMLSFKMGDIVEILDGPGKGLHGKIIGCRGTIGSADIEAVIDIDGDEYHFSTKRLKLVSKKDEKGEKKMMFNFKVVGAYPNKKKGILAVKFNDGQVIKLHCDDGDNFDVNVGVALAMAYKSCGGKNAFRRNVEKVTQEVKSKEDREDKEDKVFETKKTKKVDIRIKPIKVLTINGETGTFGYHMRKARKAKKLSQRELAILVGSGVSTIHNYERNDCEPNPKRKAKIIEVLGLK